MWRVIQAVGPSFLPFHHTILRKHACLGCVYAIVQHVCLKFHTNRVQVILMVAGRGAGGDQGLHFCF